MNEASSVSGWENRCDRYVLMLDETTLQPGRRAGMEAATIPTLTSQDRQYQFVTLAQVTSELTFCQFITVRTMQHAAVLYRIAMGE